MLRNNYFLNFTLFKIGKIMMKGLLTFLIGFTLLSSCASSSKERDVSVAVLGDLHFDLPPETDQYYHVRMINKIEGTFHIPADSVNGISTGVINKLNGVIIAGDVFDKPYPGAHELYKQRYGQGMGDKQVHYPVYPGYGNHDIDPISEDSLQNLQGRADNLAFLDSLLNDKLKKREILNLHPGSRSYSWNIGDVHFIQAHRYSGDDAYGEANWEWLAADLQKYASNGNPVVYIQHYGFDAWALKWWPESAREKLFNLLDQYNLAAFLVGHTHEASIQHYRGHDIYQVNNAWPDEDGNGSFAVVRIKGNNVVIATCRWTDNQGNYEVVAPYDVKFLK